MNETLLTWIVFILAFAGMVLIHELGHFIAARMSGIEVEEFGVGLPTPGALTLWVSKGYLILKNGQRIEIPSNFRLPFASSSELTGRAVKLTVDRVGERLVLRSMGVPLGAVAGYFGGWVDNILMRITDAALTLPSLLVLILLSAVLREVNAPFLEKNPVLTIAAVIGLLSWMFVARLARASYISIREQDFVIATRTLGATDLRIISKHILPNAIGPIIVESTLEIGYAILEESGLSYLGFGIQPPTPSWGNLLSNAQMYMTKYPWLAIFPGIMIFLTIISINYIGDGLRDAFDPYKVMSATGKVRDA